MKTQEFVEILGEINFKRLKVVEIRANDDVAYVGFIPSKDGWLHRWEDKVYLYAAVGFPWDSPIRILPEHVKWVCIYEIGDDYTLPNPITSEDGLIVRIHLK